MTHFLLIGIVLGLSAGFAPGPLMTLIISETLQHGPRAGIKVALAPVVTDIPIIAVTLLVFAHLSDFHSIAGIISLAGGCFILFMGYRSLRTAGTVAEAHVDEPRSLAKGVFANLLSPHPYLFWLTVGAPTVTAALTVNLLAAAAFITGFYVCLLGSKVAIALLVGRSRSFLRGRAFAFVSRSLGLLLCLLSLVLFRDGFRLLGLL